MDDNQKKALVLEAIKRNGGVFQMDPAWVGRDFLPPGKRLGLKDEEYDLGERGYVCERWLASITHADNAVGPQDEGLSYVTVGNGERMLLTEAISLAGGAIMGEEYAKTHESLGRLAKIYDFGARIPFHIHQRKADAAKMGHNPKEEAYYFPEDVDLGPHPETFFGVHPYIVRENKQHLLLPFLKEWKDDMILQHSRAYLNVPGEGFHLPSGVLHAPGTAVTIELQENSDVFAMLQALNAGKIISKDLLYKDVTPEDREKRGEQAVLDQVDWEISGDPYFYENRHTPPVPIDATRQDGGEEWWIYYNTTKFSGKKLVVRPGCKFESVEKGVYNALIWRGKGTFAGQAVEGQKFGFDEVLVCFDTAVKPHVIENTGDRDMIIIKFFGPDINIDVPYLKKYA